MIRWLASCRLMLRIKQIQINAYHSARGTRTPSARLRNSRQTRLPKKGRNQARKTTRHVQQKRTRIFVVEGASERQLYRGGSVNVRSPSIQRRQNCCQLSF